MTTIGITMGCPAGIGPEIIQHYFNKLHSNDPITTVVLGDIGILDRCGAELGYAKKCAPWQPGSPVATDTIPVLPLSSLPASELVWGQPTLASAKAMAHYIEQGVNLATQGILDGITTCPISKASLQQAGFKYPGHTEMLSHLTGTKDFAMMLAGSTLRVTLVTIHCALDHVTAQLSRANILHLIRLTHRALMTDFAITTPRIGVAGLNPHAGEEGLFGTEEQELIAPAVAMAQDEGIDAAGPFPPDTIFYKASQGQFDAVVCMYHDQGLIPFKLLHFHDGVNVTLGLPIVRTSVDHGTAYDIAGKGIADPSSLAAAIATAAAISTNRGL